MPPIHAPATLLALVLVPPAFAQELADPAPRETELAAERVVVPLNTSTGYAVLDVRFGDAGPFALIFDTGASMTVLDKDLAVELGLEVTGETFLGDPTDPMANRADEIVIPELAIGDAYFLDMNAVAWARPGALQRVQRGLVGLPTFRDCLVTLDYARGELRIEKGELPPANGRDVIDVRVSEYGLIEVPVTINGRTIFAHLDSGNPRSVVLPEEFMETVDIVEGSLRTARANLASGTLEFQTARLNDPITIGPVTLETPSVSFNSALGSANVGRSFLSEAAVMIDQKNRRMRIRLNGQDEDTEPSEAAGSR